jgi:FG-GAP-like repeat
MPASCRLRRWAVVVIAIVLPWPSLDAVRASGRDQEPASRPQQAAAQPEWLTDAEGRQYRLEPIPKAQAVKISEKQVRTMFGVPAELVREDEQFYYIKLYKTVAAPVTPTPKAGTSPSRAGRATRAAAAAPTEPLPPASARLRWTPAGTGLPTSGQWRDGLALADLTGDGRLDIIASGARKTLRPPSIFVSDGTTWKRATDITFAPRPFDYGDLALGDLDGNGTIDIVLGVHLRGLMAFHRDAGGAFTDASTGLPFAASSKTQSFSSRAVALTDCNGDGRLDLVALGEGPRLPAPGTNSQIAMGLATFVQQTDGTWTAAKPAEHGGLFGSSLAIADVDGDKRPDAIVAPGALGDARIVHRGDGACGWTADTIAAVRPRSYITSIAAGDVTGDGQADIVLGYTEFSTDVAAYGMDVLTRGADGQWTRRALLRDTGNVRIEAIAPGDLDGDQHADIVAVGNGGAATIFLADGRGGFTRERQTLTSAGNCQGSTIVIGDLDRDGLGDIVISYAQEASATTPGVCPGEGGIAAWHTAKSAGTAAKIRGGQGG